MKIIHRPVRSGSAILAQLSDNKAAVKASLRLAYPEQFAALRKNIADIQRKIACLDDGVDLGGNGSGRSLHKRSTLVALRDKQIARLHQVGDAVANGRYMPITRSTARILDRPKQGPEYTKDERMGRYVPLATEGSNMRLPDGADADAALGSGYVAKSRSWSDPSDKPDQATPYDPRPKPDQDGLIVFDPFPSI